MADTSPDVKDSKMTSIADELKELASLLEKGHITPDEFKGFKRSLLAREALLERIVQLEKDQL